MKKKCGIYNRCKLEIGIDFDFHVNHLYYETNDYKEGCELFFRGYPIDMASTMHKDDVKIRLKKRKWNNKQNKMHKIQLKLLSKVKCFAIILIVRGEIAQLARAIGSYPIGQEFESLSRYQEEFCSNFSSLIYD